MRAYALNPIEVRNANEEENEILRNLRKANLFYIKSDNDKIPVLLRRLHPRLNNREYMEIKDLMEFQEHKILICQNCYMELIQYLDFAGGEEFLLESIKVLHYIFIVKYYLFLGTCQRSKAWFDRSHN